MITKSQMSWKKLGQVYVPSGTLNWAKTHAFLPTPYLLNENTIRVYCAFLDAQKIGRLGYVDLDAHNPTKITEISTKPLLDIGSPGMFDEHGVSPTCVVKNGDEIRLYYQGWQRLQTIPYLLFTGLAISLDNGHSFKRYSNVPILERSTHETFQRSCGYVLREKDCWKMWYLCGRHWIETKTGKLPWYEIRYLESPDGINWGEQGITCLSPSGTDEFGFGRPYITSDNSAYTLWSSVRSKNLGYRFICAQSHNGKTWRRSDHLLNLDVSENGWDSQMVCFPSVIQVHDKTYLFYNGNQYGESGFGIAELIDF